MGCPSQVFWPWDPPGAHSIPSARFDSPQLGLQSSCHGPDTSKSPPLYKPQCLLLENANVPVRVPAPQRGQGLAAGSGNPTQFHKSEPVGRPWTPGGSSAPVLGSLGEPGLPPPGVGEHKGSLPAHLLSEIRSCLGLRGGWDFVQLSLVGGWATGETGSTSPGGSYCPEPPRGPSHTSFPRRCPQGQS